jgi:hypothetical protein
VYRSLQAACRSGCHLRKLRSWVKVYKRIEHFYFQSVVIFFPAVKNSINCLGKIRTMEAVICE